MRLRVVILMQSSVSLLRSTGLLSAIFVAHLCAIMPAGTTDGQEKKKRKKKKVVAASSIRIVDEDNTGFHTAAASRQAQDDDDDDGEDPNPFRCSLQT